MPSVDFSDLQKPAAGGGQRPINQFFAWVTFAGVAVTILGLLWGVAEFVLFVVRKYKDSGL